jgi:long-subunit acyl-CoA synthetase (AMP-forming)
MGDAANALGERIAAVLALDPSAPALEFAGRWRSWGELAATALSVAEHLPVAGTRIGVLLRNRPAQVSFVLGALRAGACVVAIDPGRGAERVRHEIASLGLSIVAGEPDDLGNLVGGEVAATRLSARDVGEAVDVTGAVESAERSLRPGVAVQMLTSGTTGAPKRIDLPYEMLVRALDKTRKRHASARIRFVEADAQRLPFADDYFEYDGVHRVTLHTRQGTGCSSWGASTARAASSSTAARCCSRSERSPTGRCRRASASSRCGALSRT